MDEINETEFLLYNPFKEKESDFFYKSEQVEDFFTILKEIFQKNNACGAILGKKGVGKSRLVHQFINLYMKDIECIFLNGENFNKEMLENYLTDYIKKTYKIDSLLGLIEELELNHKRLLIIIDNGEFLSNDNLKYIEDLCKKYSYRFSVIFIGNEELERRLNSIKFKDLRSQMKFFLKLSHLSYPETENFIKAFFIKEHDKNIKIDKKAISLLFENSKGNISKLIYFLRKLDKDINNKNRLSKSSVIKLLKNEGLEIKEKNFSKIMYILFPMLIVLASGYYFLHNERTSDNTKNQNYKVTKKTSKGEFSVIEKPIKKEEKITAIQLKNKIEKQKKEEGKLSNNTIPVNKEIKETKEVKKISQKQDAQPIKEERLYQENTEKINESNTESLNTDSKINPVTATISINPNIKNKKFFVKANSLLLRKGPGKNYPIIVGLRDLNIIVATGEESGDWIKVNVMINGKKYEGWVNKNYIKPLPAGINIDINNVNL